MDRDERARRRAAFSRPREAVERVRSLAHGLELEDEAELEEAAVAPRPRRRTTGRFVAIAAIAVFVVSSLGLLAVLADRYETEAFMRDHGVATQAVITDKVSSDRPSREQQLAYYLGYRFLPRPPAGRPARPEVDRYDAVPQAQFNAISVGQTVTVRYNPQRPSQSTIYVGPPPTDRQIVFADLLLFIIWLVLFGGLCAVIVGLAWPDRLARAERVPKAWAYR
jgi:hypothetical protein